MDLQHALEGGHVLLELFDTSDVVVVLSVDAPGVVVVDDDDDGEEEEEDVVLALLLMMVVVVMSCVVVVDEMCFK